MDRILTAGEAVKSVMDKRISYPNTHYPLLKDVIVVDETKQHYIHIFMGWEDGAFFCRTLIHIHVRNDGKVHVLTNNTDTLIEEDLIEAGIISSTIICGIDISDKEARETLGLAA